jgi:pilus assembly protein CpaE
VLPQHVEAIVRMACGMFDFVVVDAGRALSAVTLQVLDLTDRVYAVLQLTLPFIRDGKRLRDVFRSLDYPADKIQWVVNRFQKDSQLTLDDLRKTLGLARIVSLPNQYDVAAASVNQGVPVERIAPNSAIARSLRELALDIAPPSHSGRNRNGWFTGLFRAAAH